MAYRRAPSDSVSTKEKISLESIDQIGNSQADGTVLVHLALRLLIDDWKAELRDGGHCAVLLLLLLVFFVRLLRISIRDYGHHMLHVIWSIK